MSLLLLAVPLAPLAVAFLALFLAKKWPSLCGPLSLAGTAIALLALLLLWNQSPRLETLWLQSGGFRLTAGLQLDGLSRFMALLVAAVALPVQLYAIEYMAEEKGRGWFFAALSFFVGAMLALVLANSFVLLFMAWEAVGLASFLLIGFWFRKDEARRAAQRAFLMTRIGDVGFLLAWLLALRLSGTTEIRAFLALTPTIGTGTLTLVALLFFAGAIGKSAQLPLTAWLPRAMAGPTPVSALIHSATMVAAGVYLILRLFPLFAAAPAALSVVLWVGAATALFSGVVATGQSDLKRVLAWSTGSQLGEMMFALGLGGPLAAAFHLAAHAAFKSTLFLAAGSVDHATGTREIARLGNLARALPITGAAFLAGALALAGIWPLSGFWSEDQILAAAAARGPGFAILLCILVLLAGIYISRAAFAVFFETDSRKAPSATGSEAPGYLMKSALIILGLGAIGLGWALHGRLENALSFAALPELAFAWKIAALLCALAGLAFGAWRVRRDGPVPALGRVSAWLEGALESFTQAPVQLTLALAQGIDRLEGGLDRTALGLAQLVTLTAQASDRTEAGIDLAARGASRFAFLSADASDAVERHGFAGSLNYFATLLDRAGARLRSLETGQLYLYTLGLCVWSLLAVVAGFLYWR